MALDIEAEIDARIAAMEAEPQASTPAAEVRREILFIREAVFTTGTESRDGHVRGLAQVEFDGIPTPHSKCERGILRFRPADQLKAPYYKEADQTIRLWVDIAHLELVTYQLNHRKRWLWIGLWPDGYTYSDLHSRP